MVNLENEDLDKKKPNLKMNWEIMWKGREIMSGLSTKHKRISRKGWEKISKIEEIKVIKDKIKAIEKQETGGRYSGWNDHVLSTFLLV